MMPVAALTDRHPLLAHHPIGASTGFLVDERGDWPLLTERAAALFPFTAELAALSEPSCRALRPTSPTIASLPFHYLSVHAPSKGLRMAEAKLVDTLARLPAQVDAIVVHPDVIDDPTEYRRLGSRLVLENMDSRKAAVERPTSLRPTSPRSRPRASAWTLLTRRDVDPSPARSARAAGSIRLLRHLHVSSLDAEGHHVSLSDDDEAGVRPILRRCRDVPWILEAPLAP